MAFPSQSASDLLPLHLSRDTSRVEGTGLGGESLEGFLEEVLGGLRNVEEDWRSSGVSAETLCRVSRTGPWAALFTVNGVDTRLEGKALYAAVGWASANHPWLRELQLGDRINCGHCRNAYRELLAQAGASSRILLADFSSFHLQHVCSFLWLPSPAPGCDNPQASPNLDPPPLWTCAGTRLPLASVMP